MVAPMAVFSAVESSRGKRAALSIALVAAVVGLPLWWKTTETYRATLPYSEISQLGRLQLQLTVPIEVVFFKGTLTAEQQRRIPASNTNEKETVLNAHTGFTSHYEFKYRRTSIEEDEVLSLQSLQEADEALQQFNKGTQGSLSLFIVPETTHLFPQGVDVYIGKHRRSLVKLTVDPSLSTEEIRNTLYHKVERIIHTMSITEEAVTASLSDRISSGRFNKDDFESSRRAFKSSPGYEITFTLLNPDPKSHDLNWNISSASDHYIQPFLDKLQLVANFSVDSQARLGSSAASLYPVLNFLLYVPEYFHSPLYIQDKDGRRVPSNAFHSPRWGGIMVYNVNYGKVDELEFPVHVDIDMVSVMEVFLTQLRLLLGISKVYVPANYQLENPGNEGLTDWELDKLLWTRTVENIGTVTTTLTSLAQLLDQIGNIVINDNVASEVYHAVSSVQIALSELEAGRLENAFKASKEGITSSEKAFFDPSLLHLLYFPDDQKFAIYIPLFLPMAVPILLSLMKIAKEYKTSKKEATKTD
uniref:GPI transamidase component PIG-S n=1 Tax=Pyxicephalus adspersus TaxID=30357 RepID=A0AAV3BBQ7_PYXAD|nr:TPA: hypothetical protein GDO54_001860 [Pyxicephalus adspersus]